MHDPFPECDHDNDLAVRAARDKVAFSVLFERYFARVYNYMRFQTSDSASADDLTAQVFEQMLKNIQRFDKERAPFNAWLFGIARNIINRHRRDLRRENHLPLEKDLEEKRDSGLEIESRIIHSAEIEELIAAMQGLDEKKRELLALKFAGRLTNRQISALTGLSENNVGVILFRTLNRLRTELENKAMEGLPDMERKNG